jgi:DNA-directed RNA polymerase subunit F
MQIANIRPKQPLELQLIVEESEERFTEEELDELVETICKTLPPMNK